MDLFGLVGVNRSNKYIIYDTFNRADSETSLGNADTGHAWTALNSSTWGISSGAAYTPTGGNASLAVVDLGFVNNFIISATIATWDAGIGAPGIAIRATDANNLFRFTRVAAGQIMFQKKVEASITTLGNFTGLTLSPNDVLSVRMEGNVFKVYLNSSLLGTYTDSFNATETKHGLTTGTGSSTARWGDFKIELI